MTATDRQAFDAALARYLDGEPEPEDITRLAEALRGDASLRAEMSRLLEVDDLIRQSQGIGADDRSFVDALALQLESEDHGLDFVRGIERRIGTGRARRPGSKLIPWAIAASACAVAALALATRDRRPQATVALVPPAASSKSTIEPPVVALLVNEVNATFAPGAGPKDVGFGPGVYRLDAGTVHLRFSNGADVVCRSPARFTILDAMHMSLEQGVLRAVVPDSAHGFTVKAPSVDYEDLGTEFGVSVRSDRLESELHVFTGRVDLKSPRGDRISSVVSGNAVRVADGKSRSAGWADSTLFPDPSTLDFERWVRWQSGFRLDSALVCYYPFLEDPGDDRLLRDHATGPRRANGRIKGARWVSGRWPGKKALLFDNDADTVELTIPGTLNDFTIAAWINVDRLDYPLNAILNSDGWDPGDLHWQVERSGDLHLGAHSLTRSTSWKRSDPRVPVPLGQWAHVALVVMRGMSSGRMYVNGELAAETRLNSPKNPVKPGACSLGNYVPFAGETNSPRRGLRGRMDEFAVWGRSLGPDEIRGLAERGRVSLIKTFATNL